MSKAKLQNGVLSGEINTLQYFFGFSLQIIQNATSGKAPTHDIVAKKSNGTYVKVGIAWERKLQRGENAGQSMFSLVFNDPMFTETINFSCFPEGQDGTYSVNFERPRQNEATNNKTISELAPPPSQEATAGQGQQAA